MTSSLYRKYRPPVFAEVVGQEHVTRTLQNEIIQQQIAHAYLFCGMRGIGKTTVARLLAKAINCEQRRKQDSEPCNKCQSCQAINSGRSLDLLEIDAASNRRIDDIREIKEHIPYGPSQSKFKVVIVDEVHMLTTEAFNALLKTLEEPPAHVLFILCTTEVHKLPETIVSRCQRFDFKRLSSAVLFERLRDLAKREGIKVEETVLGQIVELAGGSSRDAEGYLGKLITLGEKTITPAVASLVLPHSDLAQALDFIGYLIKAETSRAVELINSFLEEGGDIAYFYRQVLNLMRKMLLVKLGGKLADEASIDLLPEFQEKLIDLSSRLTQARLQLMLERWLAADSSWRSSELWQLPLELAAVEIGSLTNTVKVEGGNSDENSKAKTATKSNLPADKVEASGLNLQQITERWLEVVADLREYNHSLSFILSVARPIKLEGETLTVGFSYQLHLDRVKDPKIIKVVEESLAKIFGIKLRLRGESDEATTGADLLSNVLTTFGGQVIE